MNDIRKIAVGPDYKSGAMHYIVGQDVLNGTHHIHLIKYDTSMDSFNLTIKTQHWFNKCHDAELQQATADD